VAECISYERLRHSQPPCKKLVAIVLYRTLRPSACDAERTSRDPYRCRNSRDASSLVIALSRVLLETSSFCGVGSITDPRPGHVLWDVFTLWLLRRNREMISGLRSRERITCLCMMAEGLKPFENKSTGYDCIASMAGVSTNIRPLLRSARLLHVDYTIQQ
jgi:hypothetical protein